MTLYKDYIEVNHDFIPVYNDEVDKNAPGAWKSFVPHQSLKEVLTCVIKSIERASKALFSPLTSLDKRSSHDRVINGRFVHD